MPPDRAFPRYPTINWTVLRTITAALAGQQRSFRSDALRLAARLRPPMVVSGAQHIPKTGPFLITANHYSRPGFSTSWIALAISSVVPREITWITVTEWVYPGQWREKLLRPLMRLVLSGIRRGYDFLAMPTMVPGYADPLQRADGVRQVLHAVQSNPQIILGLTPEGMDFPGGSLGTPPPGAGKFILALNRMGLPILPAAITEAGGRLALTFGEPCDLALPPDLPAEEVDPYVSRAVMNRIAQLMNA